ncbi:hypothetical protein TAMA11512_24280 [Selenomonas sp. TAMA-11512]|uniref:hypothetical protein n=1 Tax=Selenomonas sp. TAMA-11512 TaxID=3095337 RepID=UPI00308D08AE|nr:hypothetical protein TAMA11512_24280 [Selenomonas sp. TAMA-11512]
MNVRIAAVGSSPLIAEEIQDIAHALLSDRIPIITRQTDEITDAQTADLYLCARTQYEQLLNIIPKERLFLMELQPDSTFFFAISRIPHGSDVYIFNNYSAYPKELADYCRTLGMDQVNYIPLAFEELREEELREILSGASYIIGVDRFVGLLQKPPCQEALRPDVKIIAGKRTASLRSAFAVLRSLGRYLLDDLHAQWEQSETPSVEQLRAIAADTDSAIDILQAGAIRSVVSQAAIGEPGTVRMEHAYAELPLDELRRYAAERLQLLELLQRKIDMLNK